MRGRLGLSLAVLSLIAPMAVPPLAVAAEDRERMTVGRLFDRVETSAILDFEAGFQLRDDDTDVQKYQGTLTPKMTADVGHGWELTGTLRLRADVADELEPGQPDQDNRAPISRRLLIGDSGEAELRELYVERFVGDTFLRLGKQQIVWGQADGLKVLDVVNPQSFREFVLADFDESRIPLWSANAETRVGPGLLQLIWIPDNTFHDIPEPGATYAFSAPQVVGVPSPGFSPRRPAPRIVVDRPDNPITDSDVGVAYEVFAGGWDLSFNYLFQHRNAPVDRRRVTPDGGTEIVRGYERAHILGGSFANAFGDVTLRGEVAGVLDDFAPSRAGDGVAEAPTLDYVLGLDWRGLPDTLVSGQVFQNVFFDKSDALIRDRVQSNASLLVSRHFLARRLELEALWVQNLEHGDGFVSPEMRYQLAGNIWLRAGGDFFYGTSDGLFGQFNETDRFTVGFQIGL